MTTQKQMKDRGGWLGDAIALLDNKPGILLIGMVLAGSGWQGIDKITGYKTVKVNHLDTVETDIAEIKQQISIIADTLRHDSGVVRRLTMNSRIDSTNKNVHGIQRELAVEFHIKKWSTQ